MANYLATDTDLTAVANAIRTKGGTSAQMAFPAGFVSAVQAIPSGGGLATDEGSLVLAEDYSYKETILSAYTGLVIQTSLNKILVIALWSEEWDNQTETRPCGGGFIWVSTDAGVPKMSDLALSPYKFGAGIGMNATTSSWYGSSNISGPIAHEFNSDIPAGSFGFRVHSASYPFKAGNTLRWKVWGE